MVERSVCKDNRELFKAVWINRYRQPVEHLPATPDREIDTLTPLPGILGLGPA